ncbi:MAG: FkbM family methyltransferase [Crocinitomicaceae bacterium]
MSTKIRIFLIRKLLWSLEKKFFYPKLSKFYRKYNNPIDTQIILDVGSNRGQSIDFFNKTFQNTRIIGFEPNKELFQFLVRKYLNYQNIELINKGASDNNGSRTFYVNQLDETSSFEELNYDSIYLKKKARLLGVKSKEIIKQELIVEVIELSEFIKAKNLIDIFLLKIDVEGHEYSVLKGLFSKKNDFKIHHIQLENHQDDMYINNSFKKIEELLYEKSYFLNYTIKHVFGDFTENIYSLNNEA